MSKVSVDEAIRVARHDLEVFEGTRRAMSVPVAESVAYEDVSNLLIIVDRLVAVAASVEVRDERSVYVNGTLILQEDPTFAQAIATRLRAALAAYSGGSGGPDGGGSEAGRG